MKNYLLFAIVYFVSAINGVNGQTLTVKKTKIGEAYKIELVYTEKDSIYVTSRAGCDVRKLTYLSDSLKINAIADLLKFENDTSLCEFEITLYNSGYFKNDKPFSKVYNLQIDALFFINYLALSSAALYYSPYPLLYDKELKKEIATSYEDIKKVYAIYKKWFSGIKKSGFKNYPYPLVGTKYGWFGAIESNQKLITYPRWLKEDGCRFFD